MRLVLISTVAILVAFLLFGVVNVYPDNYVKIYVDNYLVEMSFTGFLILMFLLGAVIYLLLWFIGSSFRATTFFSRWRRRRGHRKAGEALGSGYLSLIKGDWRKAEKSLVSRSDNSSVPYINYLAAAQAAQEQSEYARRDEYLEAAYRAAPNERFAIGLAKARLYHLANQYELARATLDEIESQGKKNNQYLAMRLQNYQALKDWDKVHDLLPLARKQKALAEVVITNIDTQVHRAMLLEASDKKSVWRSLPKPQQQLSENTLIYAKYLVQNGDVMTAEKLVRNSLNSQPKLDEGLVVFYGNLKGAKPAKMRRTIEGWLMARPESAHLNLAAGRQACYEGNKDLAIQYLEKAITIGGLPEAYAVLGELLEANNDSGRALQIYRDGMAKLSHPELHENTDKSLPSNDFAPQEGELIKA